MSQPGHGLPSRLGGKALFVIASVLLASACSLGHQVVTGKPIAASAHSNAIRVASSKLITKPGSTEPKVVLSLYEDFLCPFCGQFEELFGPTVSQLIDDGSVAADYYMVAILDSSRSQHYSSRAGGAAYCIADEDTAPDMPTFTRFHAALYAKQPSETGPTFPTNAQLADTARQAGATDKALECIEQGSQAELSAGLSDATNVNSTPTVRINGEDYELSTPDALASKVKELVG
jgi:protein-disulfide isomerase